MSNSEYVKIVSDANVAKVAPGRTVGELRRQFAAGFSITAQASATLDGIAVDESVVPHEGQKLAFATTLGQKG